MKLIKFSNHIRVRLEVFDPCFTLDKLKKNKINIYDFKKVDEYHYEFITHKKNKRRLRELFNSFILIQQIGIINIIKNNMLRMSTLISLLLSFFTFLFLNNLIMDVKINGDSSSLVELIDNELKKREIAKYKVKKSNDELLIIEKEIAIELYDSIEWIEIKNIGLNVQVNYLKRRETFENVNSKKAIYATKEGIIKSFIIEKGVKKVNINEHVYAGQILIDGYLVDSKENDIFIGAIGSVYAYTWLNLEGKMEINNLDDISLYTYLLEEINSRVDKELTGNDEYIENSKVLKFEKRNNIAILKMHFTLVEDITR